MKKFLVITLILFALVGLFAPTDFAFAAEECAGNWFECRLAGLLDALNPLNAINAGFEYLLSGLITGFQYLIGFGVEILNISVTYTVLQADEWLKNSGVTHAWSVMRDLANVGIIFTLLFIGIATILGLEEYGYRRLLVKLIIVALFVNFSLFITHFIIDISNILAIDIIQSAELTGARGFAAQVMDNLQLGELSNTQDLGLGSLIMVGILGFIFVLVSNFVFIAAAILLVTRLVALIIISILAPIAFLMTIVPLTKFKEYGRRWWGALFSQAFFAPLYFLFVAFSLQILDAFGGDGQSANFGQVLGSGGTGAWEGLEIILYFAVVIGFMIASLMVAKELGAKGSEGIIKFGQKMRKGAQGWLGANTFGRAARSFGRSDWAKNIAARSPLAGRALYGGLDYVSGAGFGSGKGFDKRRSDVVSRMSDLSERVGTPSLNPRRKKVKIERTGLARLQNLNPFVPNRRRETPEEASKRSQEEAAERRGDFDRRAGGIGTGGAETGAALAKNRQQELEKKRRKEESEAEYNRNEDELNENYQNSGVDQKEISALKDISKQIKDLRRKESQLSDAQRKELNDLEKRLAEGKKNVHDTAQQNNQKGLSRVEAEIATEEGSRPITRGGKRKKAQKLEKLYQEKNTIVERQQKISSGKQKQSDLEREARSEGRFEELGSSGGKSSSSSGSKDDSES